MPSDVEHWHINAVVHKDRVEETYFISDPIRNIRRKPHTKVWQVERLLGRGGFGEVRLERNREDDKVRAVKRIGMISATLHDSDCEKELKALLEFSKPKSKEAAVFVDFFGWFKDGSDLFIAMEYVQLGDLEKNVSAHSGKISQTEARDITEQILSGLDIMHAESFAHRDLKPQNVLVVSGPPNWWIKLADFGLSKKLTETTAYHTRAGSQLYMAPEVLNYLGTTRSEYTNAVDLWATGCIVYRLITGVVPFPPGTTLIKYCENKSLFPNDALLNCGVSNENEASKFIRQLLITNPKNRLSASQALQHRWIVSGQGEVNPLSSTHPYISVISPENNTKILQPYQKASELSEPTVSNIDYNTVSHDGLKTYQSISPSHSTSSRTLTPVFNNHLEVSTKSKRRHRHSRTPSQESGTNARSSSSHSRDRTVRTPEEQAAHDKRKEERRAVSKKWKESEITVIDEPDIAVSTTSKPRPAVYGHKPNDIQYSNEKRSKLLGTKGQKDVRTPPPPPPPLPRIGVPGTNNTFVEVSPRRVSSQRQKSNEIQHEPNRTPKSLWSALFERYRSSEKQSEVQPPKKNRTEEENESQERRRIEEEMESRERRRIRREERIIAEENEAKGIQRKTGKQVEVVRVEAAEEPKQRKQRSKEGKQGRDFAEETLIDFSVNENDMVEERSRRHHNERVTEDKEPRAESSWGIWDKGTKKKRAGGEAR